MPAVSIVVPAYNHEAFVAQAVGSVLDQTFRDLEVLVIDDGSRDRTAEAVEHLVRRRGEQRRVQVVRQANGGAHAAINHGLARCSGAHLGVLNSDDYFYPDRIRRLLDELGARGGEFAFSGVHHVDLGGRRLPDDHPGRRWYMKAYRKKAEVPALGYCLLEYNLAVTTGNFLFSRRLLDLLGGFRPLLLCHDWDFLLRALHHTEPVLVDEPLMAYRLHGNNSFAKLSAVAERETYACLGPYFQRMWRAASSNPLAPSPRNWPHYFDWYVGRNSVLSQMMARAAREAHAAASPADREHA